MPKVAGPALRVELRFRSQEAPAADASGSASVARVCFTKQGTGMTWPCEHFFMDLAPHEVVCRCGDFESLLETGLVEPLLSDPASLGRRKRVLRQVQTLNLFNVRRDSSRCHAVRNAASRVSPTTGTMRVMVAVSRMPLHLSFPGSRLLIANGRGGGRPRL